MSGIRRIWQLRHARLVRVLIIGGLGVTTQTVVFELLYYFLGVRPSIAVIIGGETGVLTNFYLNNRFAFHDRGRTSIVLRLVRFHLVVSVSLLIQFACVFGAEQIHAGTLLLHIAYFGGIILGFCFNYIGYLLWVWERRPLQKE